MSEDGLVRQAFKEFYNAKYQEAAQSFSNLASNKPSSPEWKYLLASALLAIGKIEEADKLVSDLISKEEEQSLMHGIVGSARISHIKLGMILDMYLRDKKPIPSDKLVEFRNEFRDLKEGIDPAIEKGKGICLPDFYNEYGIILGLEACLELHNETTRPQENLPQRNDHQKLFSQAIDKYSLALQLDSNYVPAIHNKGMMYFEWALQLPEYQRKEKLKLALDYFEESLIKYQDYVESLLDKGTVLCHLKRYKEAKEPFLRAASINMRYTQKSVRKMGAAVLREIGINKDMQPIVAPRIVSI